MVPNAVISFHFSISDLLAKNYMVQVQLSVVKQAAGLKQSTDFPYHLDIYR